jgi:hypothetical protein
LQEIVKDLTS